jgi:hypothetical protein
MKWALPARRGPKKKRAKRGNAQRGRLCNCLKLMLLGESLVEALLSNTDLA